MFSLAIATAALLAVAPGLPRLAWLAVIMAAAFIKARLILLDFLELREAGGWRSLALTWSVLAIGSLALLAAL